MTRILSQPLGLALMASTMLVAPAVAHAQAASQTGARDQATVLDEVVVTASATGVDLRNAPASISVISREEIERQPVRSLGELLGRLPGVTGGLSPSGALSKITIRGLPDNYTLILVDGRRVGNARDISYRPDLGRQDLNWISPDMIERIEVVRGPMSSIYGSDAMGGVVNIITRRIPAVWGGSVNANYTLPENSDRGDGYQIGFNVGGPLTDTVGLRLGGTYSRTDPDEIVLAGNAGAAGSANKNLNGVLTWRPVQSQIVSFEAGYGLEEPLAPRTLGPGSPPPWGTGAPTPQSAFGAETERTNFRLSHEGQWGLGSSRLDLYRNNFENRDGGDGGFTAEQHETILDGLLNFKADWIFEHRIAVGGQYRDEELTNTQTIGLAPVDYFGNPINTATLSGDTAALFVEDQITLRDDLMLTLGARVDSHDRYGEHFSPRAYLVWRPTEFLTVKGGVSQGFRAPSLKENSAGAATQSRGGGCGGLVGMVDPVGGRYTNQGCWMAGNPDLDPEESTNYEFGLAFDRGATRFGVTYFHTDFDNKIEYAPLGYASGRWWTRMENVQRARTKGLEMTGQMRPASNMTLRGNVTWMIEAKNLDTGRDLITTPEWSAYAAFDVQATDRMNVVLSAQYTGEQLGGGSTITDGYTTVDLTTGFDVSETVTLRAGVQNLFDKEITGTGGFGYYSPGRRAFVGFTSRF